MNHCPIAYWKQRQPDALAFSTLTYREFDRLVQLLCKSIAPFSQQVLAFTPHNTPVDLAFFFAAWRMGKTVYPLSFRLPPKAIEERLELTGAKWIDPIPDLIPLELDTIDPNLMATLIETSSSSKIACHLFKSHLISAQEASKALNLSSNSRCCLNLPLFHISGLALMMRTFFEGAMFLFSDEWERATHISIVPTQLFRLLEQQQSFPHLECLLIGGAPISQSLYQQAKKCRLPLYITYGMTEAGSMVALKSPQGPTKILPHLELKLSEENEILLRGASLFSHYWGNEGRDENSWFATKDVGQFNQQSELEILGRKDRQFISGGENIQPEEIEKAILKLSHVIEVRVEPQKDHEFGMRPKAYLYCDQKIDLQTIHNFLEKNLPRFKIPKDIELSTTPLSQSKMRQLVQD